MTEQFNSEVPESFDAAMEKVAESYGSELARIAKSNEEVMKRRKKEEEAMAPFTIIVPMTGSVELQARELPEFPDHYITKEEWWGTNMIRKDCCLPASSDYYKWNEDHVDFKPVAEGTLVIDSTRVTEALAEKVTWLSGHDDPPEGAYIMENGQGRLIIARFTPTSDDHQ